VIASEFSNLFDNSNQPVMVVCDGTIVYCNPAAETNIGHLTGQPISDFLADDGCITVNGAAFSASVSSSLGHSIYYLTSKDSCDNFLYHVSARLREKIAELKLAESIIYPLIVDTEDDRLISYFQTLKKDIAVMHRMVGNLGYFQSFDKSSLNPSTFDLARVIGDIADSVPVFVGDNCPAVIFECDSGDMTVCADKNKIELAIFQLLSNSLKHTPKDGTVKINLSRSDKAFTVTVTDNGSGISPKQLACAWTPGNAEITPKGGIGIGLSIVQSIAALHGGHAVISGDSSGTAVSFTIDLFAANECMLGCIAANYDSGLSDLMLQLSEVIPAEHFSEKFTD